MRCSPYLYAFAASRHGGSPPHLQTHAQRPPAPNTSGLPLVGDTELSLRTRRCRFLKVRRTETILLASGSEWVWEYADPNLLLANIVNDSPGLNAISQAAVAKHPPSLRSPWSLVLGFGEFSPGNKLQADIRRKCMVLSFSFELLLSLLSCIASSGAALRSQRLKNVTDLEQIFNIANF